MVVVACLVMLVLCNGIVAGADNLDFSIWKSDSERWYEGVLMVTISGGTRANVCRYVSGATGYPNTTTAQYVCERLNFQQLVKVDYTYSKYSFRTNYGSNLYQLLCTADTTCTYNISSTCYSTDYYTYLSCTCNEDYYATPNGCVTCPARSKYHADHVDRCPCSGGFYWSEGACISCQEGTFSRDNNADNCTACPAGSLSEPGSDHCNCLAGLYMDWGECQQCQADYYSMFGSTGCTACPDSTTGSSDGASCSCPTGTFWDSNKCSSCPAGTFWDSNKCSVEVVEEQEKGNYLNTGLLVVVMCMLAAISLAMVWWKYRGTAGKAAGEEMVFSAVQEVEAGKREVGGYDNISTAKLTE